MRRHRTGLSPLTQVLRRSNSQHTAHRYRSSLAHMVALRPSFGTFAASAFRVVLASKVANTICNSKQAFDLSTDGNDKRFPGAWSRYSDNAEYVQKIRRRASEIRRRIAGPPIDKEALAHLCKDGIKKLQDARKARLRHANDVARRYIAKSRGRSPISMTEATQRYEYKPHTLLDGLCSKRKAKFKDLAYSRSRRGFKIIDLRNMSFTHNPRETMERLAEIVERDCDSLALRVNFHDEYCLDVGPFLVLSSMWKDLQVERPGGDISEPMGKVLNALEIDQELEMLVPIGQRGHQDVYPVPILNRRRAGTSKSGTRFLDDQTYEKIAGRLTLAIDGWLTMTASQSLNRRGRRNVLKLVTETLNNAERHGDIFENGNDGDWAVGGFMARRSADGADVFRCHLAFLSTGTTIEETIATAGEPTKSAMQTYVERHRRAIGSRERADGHLRTVYALQDGVTRSAAATADKRNGTGFQDILEFYSDLAGGISPDGTASLAIVSGHTCVLCNGAYMSGTKKLGGDSERELWFNEPNDRNFPPDAANVIELGPCLKGTLISMAFTLDLEYLERTVDSAN